MLKENLRCDSGEQPLRVTVTGSTVLTYLIERSKNQFEPYLFSISVSSRNASLKA